MAQQTQQTIRRECIVESMMSRYCLCAANALAAIKRFCGVRRMTIKHQVNSYVYSTFAVVFRKTTPCPLYLYRNYEWTLGVRCAFVEASYAVIIFTVKLVQNS